MAGGMPDRETMMAEMKKYSDAQDEMIKAMLTEEQFAIWKDKIEPSMRPQRPAGRPPGEEEISKQVVGYNDHDPCPGSA